MTCIAGVVHKGVIYMGGDACASSGSTTWQVNPDSKVFQVGEALIGVCGSHRILDLLKFSWQGLGALPSDMTPDRFLRTTFVQSVWDCMEKYKQNDDEGILDASFLIGLRGKLYEFQDDYSILSVPDWGMAIGSGGDPARGSLYTTRSLKMRPEQRIKAALEAAEAVTPSVRAPFNILTLGKKAPNTTKRA